MYTEKIEIKEKHTLCLEQSVNIINIKVLKISEDRTVDVDCVKGMSAMSLYGHIET